MISPAIPLSRRRFLAGSASLAAMAGLGLPHTARAETEAVPITIGTRQIEIGGRAATVYGLTGPGGGAGLTAEAGTEFAVRLTNALDEPSLVHWHGLTPPWRLDGVPGLSQPPIAPGTAQDYRFPLTRGGTHWMHSHLGLQEQRLLAAPLIVRDPAERELDEQEVVVLLHDFSFRAPEEILAELQGGGGHGMQHGAMGSAAGMGQGGMAGMGQGGMSHGGMAQGEMTQGGMGQGTMAMADLNDIAHDAYLANDRTLDDPEVVTVEPGGRVRLRIINAAASTNFSIDLGKTEAALIAVDGNPVVPVSGHRFPAAIAQRLDIRLSVPAGSVVPVLALREGTTERSGIVLAARGAAVARLASKGEMPGPVVGLALERALRALVPLAARPADRRIEVGLTGTMQGYAWGMTVDGMPGGRAALRTDERVEMVLRNPSMMAHPMHLHGHHFQVTGIGAQRFSGALRDTVLVPPMTDVTIAFDADNPGRWAFHCHHLYHMAAGMMTTVEYAGAA